MLATIIVLSNLAGVAVQFLYQFIGSAVDSEMISSLWENKLINVATCLVFLAIATYVAYRGVDTTERVQMVLASFQLVMRRSLRSSQSPSRAPLRWVSRSACPGSVPPV